MFTPYRDVLSLRGAWAFSLSGLVARLPISMVSLGIVLLVSTRTGSYALAGGVSASFLIANAVFAVPQGRLVDRLGQARVLPVAAAVFGIALSLMMWSVESRWAVPLPHALAAVSGAAMPQIGSSVRARWSILVADKRQLHTAFSFEAVVDEAVFIVGPTLVTLLATAVHPLAGLTTAVAAGVLGTVVLAAQRRTEPPVMPKVANGRAAESMPWGLLAPLVLASFAIGALFGGSEVATVAFAEEVGHKSAAGPLLALWALGSLLSGLITGAVTWHSSTAVRFRWGALALAVSITPLPFVDSLPLMGVMLFVAGFAISPTMIASVAFVEEVVPASRLTEGITMWSTGLGAGVAPGAAAAGVVIDRMGASAAYWVPAVSGLVAAVIAFLTAVVGRGGSPARYAEQEQGVDSTAATAAPPPAAAPAGSLTRPSPSG